LPFLLRKPGFLHFWLNMKVEQVFLNIRRMPCSPMWKINLNP
jgi:hypothetical protein